MFNPLNKSNLEFYKYLIHSFITNYPDLNTGLIYINENKSKLIELKNDVENMIQLYNECVDYVAKENLEKEDNLFLGLLKIKNNVYESDHDSRIWYGIFLIEDKRIYYNHFDIYDNFKQKNKIEIENLEGKWEVFDLINYKKSNKEGVLLCY